MNSIFTRMTAIRVNITVIWMTTIHEKHIHINDIHTWTAHSREWYPCIQHAFTQMVRLVEMHENLPQTNSIHVQITALTKYQINTFSYGYVITSEFRTCQLYGLTSEIWQYCHKCWRLICVTSPVSIRCHDTVNCQWLRQVLEQSQTEFNVFWQRGEVEIHHVLSDLL